MALSPAQLTLLRDRHPHFANWYLSVFAADTDTVTAAGAPGVVYAGTLSGAHNRGARNIAVANLAPAVGNIANVDPGQTVLVGTSLGDASISKRRLRHWDGQVTLTLDGNGVVWTAGDYITVIENYEFWPVFPTILDVSPYTMYKDDNITYGLNTYTDFDATTANRFPDPVAIMGPPWAGWITGGSVTVTLVASESYGVAPGATISTYLWATTGGTIDDVNVADTTITFTSCGVYWITLTITDSNGKTQRTRRPFFVHDEDTCPPFYDFTGEVSLTFDQGNDMRVSALRNVDFDEIPDQALVVLWADEWFRDANNPVDWTKESIGGYTGREHIKFVGYLDKESIQSDPEDIGALTFDAYSIDKIMTNTMMWAIALNDVRVVPTTWYQYQNINTARAIHHLWRWHSTLFLIADVRLPVDATLPVPGPPDNDTLTSHSLRRFAMDWSENNLVAQARVSAHDQGIYANIGCDKQGIVYAQVDPLMIAEGVLHTDERGVVDEIQGITDEDWYEQIEFIRNERFRAAWTTLSGLNWDGATKTPLVAVMPGEDPGGGGNYDSTPEVAGSVIEEGNKLLDDQADANEKVGLRYARGNNDLSEIRVPEFAGNYSHVDVYPQAFYNVDIPPNKRGLDTADTRRGVPRQVTIGLDMGGGAVNVSAVLEPETIDVVDGVPGKYPVDIPDPTPNAPPDYPNPEEDAKTLFTGGYGDGIFWTPDTGTTWYNRKGSRAGAELNTRSAHFDPWGPNAVKQRSYNPETAIVWDMGTGYIFRSLDGGRTWMNVTPVIDPPNAWNDTPAPTPTDLTYEQAVADWHVNKQWYVIAWYQNASSEYRGYLLHTDNDGASWTQYALGSDNLSVATWGYGDSVIAPTNAWLWCDVGDFGSPSRLLVTPNNILAANGAGGGMRIDYIARPDNTGLITRGLIIDFGTWFRFDSATLDGTINAEARLLSITDTMTITDATIVDIDIDFHNLHWINCSTSYFNQPIWDGSVAAYPPATPSIKTAALNSGQWVRYAFLDLRATAGARYRGTGYYQHLFDYVRVYPHVVNDEIRPTSIDIDRETGRFLYVSTWEGARLRVRIYDTNNSLQYPVCIVRVAGYEEVARADLDARSKWIAVKSLYDPSWANYGTRFAYYGLWRRNAGNYDNIREGYVSGNKFFAGGTLADDASWLSTEWIGGLIWVSQDHLVAILNRGANDPELWETDDHAVGWDNQSTIPFTSGAGKGVEFGVTMHGGTGNVIAAGDRNGDEVFRQASDYTGAWVDITPAAAGGSRIGATHWIYNVIP